MGVRQGCTHLPRPLNQDGDTEQISVGCHVHMTESTRHKHFILHMNKHHTALLSQTVCTDWVNHTCVFWLGVTSKISVLTTICKYNSMAKQQKYCMTGKTFSPLILFKYELQVIMLHFMFMTICFWEIWSIWNKLHINLVLEWIHLIKKELL